jgi:hypothetical protein
LRLSAVLLLGTLMLGVGCGQRKQPAPASKEDFVGDWKVKHPQLGTYFMTLNPDGSGSSTLTGGELGRWEWKADHIELEWSPKSLTFYFDSGHSAPKDSPSLPASGTSTAEKIEK